MYFEINIDPATAAILSAILTGWLTYHFGIKNKKFETIHEKRIGAIANLWKILMPCIGFLEEFSMRNYPRTEEERMEISKTYFNNTLDAYKLFDRTYQELEIFLPKKLREKFETIKNKISKPLISLHSQPVITSPEYKEESYKEMRTEAKEIIQKEIPELRIELDKTIQKYF